MKKLLKINCDIELEHIQIEIKHQRGQHLRHFIDQYFCYKHRYVTSTGKPAWKKIFWNEYVSEEAQNKGGKVTKEHIVPLSVLKSMLLNLGSKPKISDIKEILDNYVCFATITKDENKKLNDAGFNKKMPSCCYENGRLKECFDKFCRYKKAGIKISKVE